MARAPFVALNVWRAVNRIPRVLVMEEETMKRNHWSKSKARRLLARLILAIMVPAAAFATGSQEVAAPSADTPYLFSFAYGMWDLSRGRIPVKDQPESPYFKYVLN